MQLCEMDEQIEGFASYVKSLDVSGLTGADAADLVERFSRLERVAAAGKTVCAGRVAETGYFGAEGARDAATWLAQISGDSRSAANDALDTAQKLDKLPSLDGAFRGGDLSGKQAHEVARAGALDPSSEEDLLRTARSTSLGGLRDKADKVAAAARSKEEDEERHRRIHAGRHLRTCRSREGAFEGRFSLTPEDGAKLMGPIRSLADLIFEQAWREGRDEPREAYLADALVCLATGEGPFGDDLDAEPPVADDTDDDLDGDFSEAELDELVHGTDSSNPQPPAPHASDGPRQRRRRFRPDYTVIMRIDLEALRRGYLRPGEESSIDGVGHVPISVIQSYLDEAKVRLVVTDGVDVRSIFSFKRNIRAALNTALHHRDRTCVVPGCESTFRLERDHVREFAKGGPTTLENLCLVCSVHHKMKSTKGFRIEGGPGHWRWVKPDGTPAGPYEREDDPVLVAQT
jgi:hypothetical protein